MLLRSLLVMLACLSLAFAVTPAQAAQVQLAWDAPTQANGTPVPNLAGYRLYYGSQSGQYPTMIPVGMTTTYTVTNLSAGQTYYFAAKTYDSTGTESALSNEVSVTLPTNTPSVTPPTNTLGGGIIPQQQMRVVSVDSQELVGENGAVTNALDGNTATFWHTEWYQQTAPLPHTLVLDLGSPYQVDGFRYLPRQDGYPQGTMASYQFYVSDDGTTWGTPVAAGTLAADTTEKTVRFTAKTGRYVRLVALSEIHGGPWTSAAELNVFGTKGTPPSVNLSASPASLTSGQAATVTWSATNATSCSATWTPSTATAGSQSVRPTSTTTYTMNCTGAGGTASASTAVSVAPKPSMTLSASPASLASGQAATVTWSATNATSCSATWTPSTATAGSQSVRPTSTTTYTMNCTGAGGTTSASTVVTVTSKPSMTLSASPASLASGQAATVTWSATNATSCSATWTPSTATAGSQSVRPTSTTTYTMNCTGAGGTASASTVVTVTSKPSMTLSASPASLASGQAATVTWSATNATSCSATWTPSTATAGSQSVRPTSTTTYTMNCTGAGGTASASTAVSVTSKPSMTLSVHPTNPRYFTDDSSKAIYLTGSHTWNTVQDFSDGTPLPGGSFSGYLDWLQRYNLNFIRFWMVEHAWDADVGSRIEPLPWARTGPGSALDGKPKFDLTRFDEIYFDRLRQRAIEARDRGFYVSIMLFDDWSTENPGAWQGHPFHISNNVQGVNADGNNDGLGVEFHTLQIPAIIPLQEAYIKKVIDTVNDLDNILYEIANETGVSKDWQYFMIDFIKQYELSKPKQHPIGMTVGWPALEVDNAALFASSADWISPNAEGGYRDNPPAANGSKVIFSDTDHLWGIGGDHTWVWKSFTRGLYTLYMDAMQSDTAVENTRKNMGYTLTYANKMNLAAMIPSSSSTDCSTTYCLRNPGQEYLVYQPNPGSFTVNLSSATYSYEWFNPSTGSTVITGMVTASSGSKSFSPPFTGDAVLYLKNQTPGSAAIPQQQMRVVSVDSQELVGENGAVTNALDGNTATFWHTEWYQQTAPLPHTLVLDLGSPYQVDGFRYLPRQDGYPQGTMASYQFYVSDDGTTWGTPVAAGTLAADTTEKTVRFTAKTGRYVRLVALSEIHGGPWTSAAELNVFGTKGTPPSVNLSASPASLTSGQAATVTWSATNATSCSATWTPSTATAGSQSVRPTSTTTYTMNCTGAGGPASASTAVSIKTPVSSLIPQQQLRVVSVDSQELVGENGAVTNALDGNTATFWHTEWYQRTPSLPHTLVLDLGSPYQVDGFRYLPRQDGYPQGTMASYQFYVSNDGTTWGTPVAAGTLAADTTEKTVRFTAKTGRYVRLVALSEIHGGPWTSAAEFNVFGTAATSLTITTSSLVTPSVTTSSLTSSTTTTASQPTTQKALATAAPVTSSASTPTTTTNRPSTQLAATTAAQATSSAATPITTASQHTRWEMTLTSTKTYANPFTDVTVAVEYTKAGAPTLQGYGFWDGGATFKLRQAFPTPGTWHYKTMATDPSDSGLHNREGDVQVLPYTGTNPLYRHGFLQVSADHRFFAHADGTPFLWLGDTLWGATVWLTEAGFHAAVADRRAKHFTVLQTNFAREDDVDTAGDTPWQRDRWNVRFMQKLDRMFSDANDQGMYLFVNGLVDLFWDRGLPHYERLVEMIGARYATHFVSFASSMADAYNPLHEQINATLRLTAPRTLLTQHPGAAPTGQGAVETTEQYYDTPFVDYVMDATGGEGDLEVACQHVIEWSLRLYNHVPPKPVVNGAAWYEGVAGGTAAMTAQLGYLSLLSGNVGYTYGTSLWNATDADLPAWKAFRGATYMQYLYDFFAALDEGRPFQPRHRLIKNQATHYKDQMVLGVSTDGMTYAAFLPNGGTISLDLTALAGTTVGVTWYNPLTGQYHDQGTTSGGAVHVFISPFGVSQSALVLMAH